MKSNEALAAYFNEYTRLFESLYKAHRVEKELLEKCDTLQAQVEENEEAVDEFTRTISSNNEEIEKLKLEIVDAIKRADAAHTRELNAQEVIENLRLNVTQLNQEIQQKNRQLAASEDVSATKQKENLMKEKEKLTSEMDTLRQRLKNVSLYTDELEARNVECEQQITEMRENIDTQLSEISKERRARQRAEDELHQLQEELAATTNDLETAHATIKEANAIIAKLEGSLKEHRMSADKTQKEMNKLMVKKMNLQTDYDNATVQIENLDKEVAEKDKQLKETKQMINRLKAEVTRNRSEKDLAVKRAQKFESERSSFEQQLRQAVASTRNREHELFTLRKQQTDKQQQVEVLLREKNILARTKETLGDHIKKQEHEITVCEYSRRKIEYELDSVTQNVAAVQKQMSAVEKERDKNNLIAQDLAQQVENYLSEVKLKQVEISTYKRRLVEAETKYRQQQNLFESVRTERNSLNKNLTEAHDEIQELKNKLKVLSHQTEQLKEDIVAKEAGLIKEEFLRGKVEKEKEGLKVELEASRKEVSELRREIEEMRQEEKSLRQVIQRAEADIGRHVKDIDNVMNERDILGTQLVRRNDELSLQYSRIKVLHGTLQRGEVQYNQRLEDIRLLKLEVQNLRTEKALLAKNIANMSDLRQEAFRLNRDLTRERLKVMALEEEVQTPLNIHRWRKLEGSDPATYELVRKVQILQKRVLKMASELIDKEKKIRDTEKLYMNLREILSKHPGPHVMIALNKTQKALRERGQKTKCLLAEVSMYELQIGEYRLGMDRMNTELAELKKKYYAQKRLLQKTRESRSKSFAGPSLPAIGHGAKRFCGGGYKMAAPTPRNCFTADDACR
ncbi:cilia- and flagella-associated protein 58 [Nomia melanderi]|uniref:cilia- and flagella-associated protein 58 n=1 Tax=Nomia melanderi TaxID=2448451 RepID=UPI003FCCE963